MQPYSNGDPGFHFYSNGCVMHNQQQGSQGHGVPNPNHHVLASNILNSLTLATLFENQWQEIDNFINSQNYQMNVVLQHQRGEQIDVLRRFETYSQQLLIRKNEELARVVMQIHVLQNHIRILEAEKMEFKRIAEEREMMLITLQNKLEEEKRKARMLVEIDVESCCGESEEERALKRRNNYMVNCSNCNTNSSCVLFLPCRHLCSCKVCEALLEVCPICGMEKKGATEIQNLIL